MLKRTFRLVIFLSLSWFSIARSAEGSSSTSPAPSSNATDSSIPAPLAVVVSTDPSYMLRPGDSIAVSIYGQNDLNASQTLSRNGEVKLTLIGDISLLGKTVREAEMAIEAVYREREFLKKPVVNIVVTSYFPREIKVLGAVRSPGSVGFPRDATTMDIVDVITKVGGFLPIAKSEAVVVIRRLPDGKEDTNVLNLDDVMSGRRKAGRDRADFAIYPGDRIWVPERLF